MNFIKKIKSKFDIGDFVRISIVKGLFEKGATSNWSSEIYKISNIDKSHDPIMYEIADKEGDKIEGKIYQQELQHTNIPDFQV